MRKILSSLVLSGLVSSSLLADIELTLIDKDGNQTSQCVKSYSFSNNLESMARQKNTLSDIYSVNETLTNKIWKGKPVYRKIHELGNLSHHTYNGYSWKSIPISNPNAETLVHAYMLDSNTRRFELYYDSTSNHLAYNISLTHFQMAASTIKAYAFDNVTLVLEYTKTTDVANTNSTTQFKSYLHYVPSSSTTDEVTTVDLKETGVRFLDNFTYDSNIDSCIAN